MEKENKIVILITMGIIDMAFFLFTQIIPIIMERK